VPGDAASAFYATAAGDLDHWLDESLSHWMWHGAWVALSLLLLGAGLRATAPASAAGNVIGGVGGAIHGLTFFLVTVEGVTTLLGIPATIAFLVWTLAAARRGLDARVVVVFFLASSIATLVGYVAWAAMNGWTLPEFSKVGAFQ
jgi:hypothetical protein